MHVIILIITEAYEKLCCTIAVFRGLLFSILDYLIGPEEKYVVLYCITVDIVLLETSRTCMSLVSLCLPHSTAVCISMALKIC